MNITFENNTSSSYALDPQIVKRRGENGIRFSQSGCTHFFLFTTDLEKYVDLSYNNQNIITILTNIKDRLLNAHDLEVPELNAKLTCIDYGDYVRDGNVHPIGTELKRYTVCGGRYDLPADQLTVFLQTPGTDYEEGMSLDFIVKVTRHTIVKKEGLLRKTIIHENTPFYKVEFGECPGYRNGFVSYSYEDVPYDFPVTESMIGKTVWIKMYHSKPPEFKSMIRGVNILNKSE